MLYVGIPFSHKLLAEMSTLLAEMSIYTLPKADHNALPL